MPVAERWSRRPRSVRWLTRTFLGRLFETELTAGSHDVKAAAIWLMCGLAAPGFVLPVLLLGWDWSTLGRRSGPELLAQVAWPDKLLYVGLAMVASGLVSALVWGSLLLDRRDALVLGALPVRPRAVIAAKLSSVVVYVLVLSAGAHVLSSLTFGALLAGSEPRALFPGVAAHFSASFLASAFVLLSVTSLQAVTVLVAGPRRMSRTAAWLQALLVATMLVLLFSLPSIGHAVWSGLGGARAYQDFLELIVVPGLSPEVQATTPLAPWLMRTPPVWFLGVYESVRGTDVAAFHAAARTGVAAVGTLAAITLVLLPLAYRRVMVSAVEAGDETGTSRRDSRPAEWLVRAQGRSAVPRGVAMLLVLTTARVARHRFVIAAAVGLMTAWVLPVLLRPAGSRGASLGADMAGLPFAFTTLLIAALRIAAALPSDLAAGWALSGLHVSDAVARRALGRALWAVGVVPVVVVAAPMFFVAHGWQMAVCFLALAVAGGAFAIEAMLVGYRGLPCAHPWQTELPLLRRFGIIYLAGALVPLMLSGWALTTGTGVAVAVVLGCLALFTRLAAGSAVPAPAWDLGAHEPAFRTLGLD